MGKIRHKILADFLLALHILWGILLIGGTFFILEHRWYVPWHMTLISATLFFNLFFDGCPITWWEEKYRRKWDPNVYYHPNSFAVTYFRKIFRINASPRQVIWVLMLIKIASYYTSALILTNLI
ncbi:MAG: DUF2784 family protein [Candidatus Paceibacterota bacterium]